MKKPEIPYGRNVNLPTTSWKKIVAVRDEGEDLF